MNFHQLFNTYRVEFIEMHVYTVQDQNLFGTFIE